MKELHALVDYENVQPTLEELVRLAPGFTNAWLFHGPHQIKVATQFKASHERITLVPISKTGKNALDFHLTFYLGYVAAKHPDAHLVVVANDKGYDPMIAHARLLNFTVKRMGHKAKPSSTAKPPPKPVAEAAVKVVAPAAAKKPAPAAKAKPAPAKKTAPAIAPVAAKKAAAKKAPVKKSVAKKSVSSKPPAPKVAALPKAAMSADAKVFTRIKNGLAKMGDKAPHKLKSFQRHIGALLGKGSTVEQVEAMVQKLEKAGAVHIAGDLVLY